MFHHNKPNRGYFFESEIKIKILANHVISFLSVASNLIMPGTSAISKNWITG